MNFALAKTIKQKIPSLYLSFHSLSDPYTQLIEAYSRDRALRSGQALHARLIINGLSKRSHFASKLIAFYVECKQLPNAHKLFDKIPTSNIRRWVVLIGSCARHGFYQEAMDAFFQLQRKPVKPNKFMVPSVLKACGHLSARRTGEEIHTVALKFAFESDAFVTSALIDMYSKCGEIERARRVFDGMAHKDLVALNAMVLGYVQHGHVKEALSLVPEMILSGIKPNVVTWNTLIAGFSQENDEIMVRETFRLMGENGIEPDVISWTSVLTGLVQNFRNKKAFDTFKQMLEAGFFPTTATISGLLPACASVADLRHGKEIHGYAVVMGMEKDVFVRSALIDMYAKCGCLNQAWALFCNMPDRNTVTWNAMIFGYANNGHGNEAIALFNQMVEEDERKLNHLTFTAVLTACSHAGMVDLGESLFQLMQKRYGIEPRLEHYACMVDLLGRAGKLMEAYDFVQRMPIEPDLFVWGSLLGACRQHGRVDLAEIAASKVAKLEPESPGCSLLLSNLYSDSNSWGKAVRQKKMMVKMGLNKLPGCSWIESV
ncbi:hypothetical protein M9H77_15830 [Catharanthus roseus]|uniref:Uncharacterized protein n=1 Tax=Catharanthus roseus TaxID=4058 RepID=A0ACC0AZR9_CATRO|nr:hypothetical protein M9H77_15830 [Catharanthus roseus]